MKTKLFMFALIAATLVGFSSCKKIKDLLSFSMKYNQDFTIPGSISTSSPLDVTPPYINTNSESTFKSKNTASKLIKEVTLSEMSLTVTAPDTGTYDFLSLIEVYIKSDGQSEILLASKTNVPANPGETLNLDVTSANLMEYVKADKFTLRVRMQADKTILTEYANRASMTFKVQADPL
jgi:hypothetical protein